jgi:hypothetical protein
MFALRRNNVRTHAQAYQQLHRRWTHLYQTPKKQDSTSQQECSSVGLGALERGQLRHRQADDSDPSATCKTDNTLSCVSKQRQLNEPQLQDNEQILRHRKHLCDKLNPREQYQAELVIAAIAAEQPGCGTRLDKESQRIVVSRPSQPCQVRRQSFKRYSTQYPAQESVTLSVQPCKTQGFHKPAWCCVQVLPTMQEIPMHKRTQKPTCKICA